MNNHQIFRDLYQPLQPGAGNGCSAGSHYREFLPSAPLQPYVHCYWLLQSETALPSPFACRFVPDGCVEIFIDCKAFAGLFIIGITDKPAIVSLNGRMEYFGVRFMPGGIHAFFPLHLREITNKIISCQALWGNRFREFELALFSAASTRERINRAEAFLTRRLLENNRHPDARLLAALEKIYHQRGQIPVEKSLSAVMSPRQLRRFFDTYIGFSPKTFSRIVRFQSVLAALRREPQNDLLSLSFDFGYYDQAHFIHEFKEFYGLPPASVNGRRE